MKRKEKRQNRYSITFVRAGEKVQPRSTSSGGQLQVDLRRQLKFPEHITATPLRPDIVLTLVSTKQVVLLELTVPWKDRLGEANERKRAKYTELVVDCRSKGWETVEVG